MKMVKRTLSMGLALWLVLSTGAGFAHSGRTDGSGGHRDNRNKSGLGSYHYHCGGYPAHLHSGGVCPYSTPRTETYDAPEAASKPAAKPAYHRVEAQFDIGGNALALNGIVEEGTTLVPLRGLCDVLEIDVQWAAETSTVTCRKGAQTVVLKVDATTATIDGKQVALTVSPKLVEGQTLLPARFIAEAFGHSVAYDPETKKTCIGHK